MEETKNPISEEERKKLKREELLNNLEKREKLKANIRETVKQFLGTHNITYSGIRSVYQDLQFEAGDQILGIVMEDILAQATGEKSDA